MQSAFSFASNIDRFGFINKFFHHHRVGASIEIIVCSSSALTASKVDLETVSSVLASDPLQAEIKINGNNRQKRCFKILLQQNKLEIQCGKKGRASYLIRPAQRVMRTSGVEYLPHVKSRSTTFKPFTLYEWIGCHIADIIVEVIWAKSQTVGNRGRNANRLSQMRMTRPERMPEAGKAVSLEVVEIELALGAQDIVADGFEGALRKAAELVNGEVIFNIRAPEDSEQQRIAAISVSDGTTDQTVFVMLGKDGTSLTVTSEQDEATLLNKLGTDFAAIMKGLRP
ncbi:MAG: hypothetical protein AAAC48_26420 [Phyllobacterium sp.]|uniref:hypothetical protein n=1 Tax=Phyllobacterium sp. TaxID=1871046 RepID=UPI0030F2BD94